MRRFVRRRGLCAVAFTLLFAGGLGPACGSSDGADEGFSGGGGGGGVHSGGGSAGTGASSVGGYAAFGGAADGGNPDAKPKLGPPYPIVLAHGFFGFDKFAGLDAITYFYGVKDYLASQGEPLVYTPAVDPFNDSTYRGAELLGEIQKILGQTGYAKVNIIGHSQGGLDARVVAHDRPDLVASVTTIATPHGGTAIADVITGAVSDPNAQKLVDWLVQQIGYALYDTTGQKTSLWKPLELFSKAGIQAFNEKYPNRASVSYWSLTGRTALKLGPMECVPDQPVPFIDKYQYTTDSVDALLSISEAYLGGGIGHPYTNDGLVRVKDAKWGTFLGCVPADHLDEVGQLFGDAPGIGNSFDHQELYAGLVAFLRAQGL